MTQAPPAPSTAQAPPSGYARAATAQQGATAAAAILAAAELAILQAVAGAITAVLAGAAVQSIVTRRLQAAVTTAIMSARAAVAAQLSQASRAVRADVQAIISAELGPLSRLLPAVPLPSVARLSGDLHKAEMTAAESALAAYRDILRRTAGLTGPLRTAGAQSLLDDLAASGLRAFTGRDGHHWGLGTYGEAATSGAIARAHSAMQLSAYEEAGIGLVIVVRSSPKPPCPRCAPYVGRVLSLGDVPRGPVTASDFSGSIREVHVTATVAEATARGLLHIECKDSLSPFADGADLSGEIPHGPAWIAAQEQQYRAAQQQRRLGRALRIAERQRAVALTPQARTRARRIASALRGAPKGTA